jgi:hypothetical protein
VRYFKLFAEVRRRRIAIQLFSVIRELPLPWFLPEIRVLAGDELQWKGVAIPEECKISQKTQIAPLQIALQPGALR